MVGTNTRGLFSPFWAAVLVLGSPSLLSAQTRGAGYADNALPGIVRVGVPLEGPAELGISGTGSYGYTEPVESGDGDHHRVGGSLAASIRPIDWLSIWLRADGRYDMHPEDAFGQDDGLLGVPSAGVRVGGQLAPVFALGGEVELLVPGRDAPSLAGTAITLEGRLLGALTLPDDGLTVAAMAGFRFDNSGASVRRPVDLRRGDRIALGVSDSHAIVAGIGVSYRIDLVELLAEFSLQALVGDQAPDFGMSPMRADLAARLHLTDMIAIELGGEVVTSGRPNVAIDAPLVPIEPRFTVRAALRVAIPLVQSAVDEDAVDEDDVVDEAEVALPTGTGQVRGRLLDESGAPVSGARVVLTHAVEEGEPAPLEVTTDADGSYAFESVPVGPAALRLEADGFTPVERAITVTAGATTTEDSTLEHAMPNGQLRGQIRSFDGSPLEARIFVEDLELEARSDAEGYFEVDVPPGTHTVVLEAPGHRAQRREVEVPENGVTVLNADLRRGRGGRGR